MFMIISLLQEKALINVSDTIDVLTLLESINAEEREEGTISVSYIGLSVAPTMAK